MRLILLSPLLLVLTYSTTLAGENTQQTSDMLKYLATTKVKNVKMDNCTIEEAVRYLADVSDSEKIHYIIDTADLTKKQKHVFKTKRISLLYDKIILSDLIRIICFSFNCIPQINEKIITFSPKTRSGWLCGGVYTRIYKIPKNKIKDIRALPSSLDKCNIEGSKIAYDRQKENLYIQTERDDLFQVIESFITATGLQNE